MTMTTPTAYHIRNAIPDCAPATAFAPRRLEPTGEDSRTAPTTTPGSAPIRPAVSRHGSMRRGTWRRQVCRRKDNDDG